MRTRMKLISEIKIPKLKMVAAIIFLTSLILVTYLVIYDRIQTISKSWK